MNATHAKRSHFQPASPTSSGDRAQKTRPSYEKTAHPSSTPGSHRSAEAGSSPNRPAPEKPQGKAFFFPVRGVVDAAALALTASAGCLAAAHVGLLPIMGLAFAGGVGLSGIHGFLLSGDYGPVPTPYLTSYHLHNAMPYFFPDSPDGDFTPLPVLFSLLVGFVARPVWAVGLGVIAAEVAKTFLHGHPLDAKQRAEKAFQCHTRGQGELAEHWLASLRAIREPSAQEALGHVLVKMERWAEAAAAFWDAARGSAVFVEAYGREYTDQAGEAARLSKLARAAAAAGTAPEVATPPPLPWWSVLGVEQTASWQRVKQAFRPLALENHPDKGGDPQRMRAILAAYSEAREDVLGH